jgi:hypothetical protein
MGYAPGLHSAISFSLLRTHQVCAVGYLIVAVMNICACGAPDRSLLAGHRRSVGLPAATQLLPLAWH